MYSPKTKNNNVFIMRSGQHSRFFVEVPDDRDREFDTGNLNQVGWFERKGNNWYLHIIEGPTLRYQDLCQLREVVSEEEAEIGGVFSIEEKSVAYDSLSEDVDNEYWIKTEGVQAGTLQGHKDKQNWFWPRDQCNYMTEDEIEKLCWTMFYIEEMTGGGYEIRSRTNIGIPDKAKVKDIFFCVAFSDLVYEVNRLEPQKVGVLDNRGEGIVNVDGETLVLKDSRCQDISNYLEKAIKEKYYGDISLYRYYVNKGARVMSNFVMSHRVHTSNFPVVEVAGG